MSGNVTTKIQNIQGLNVLSPTMISSYSKMQNLRQIKKQPNEPLKLVSKIKTNVKRKNSKDKRISKIIDGKKQAARLPANYEVTDEGFQYPTKNQTSDATKEKKANTNLSDYVQVIKRNSSLEEYNFKSDITAVKGHKRSSQDAKNIPVYLKNNLSKWEENGNASPSNTRTKLAKDKLKRLTTQIGSGMSRNNTNKGVLSTSLLSKGSKKSGKISPNYMTQGVGSYYLKGKNCSVLSK